MSTPKYLLETIDLGISFGGVHAINGVNFSLTKGELRCLIGPNGAGKSTFFKLLTGEHQPTRGSVVIGSTNIAGMQSHQISRLGVGIKTQVPSVFNGLMVKENIWVAACRKASRHQANKRVADIIEQLRLGDIQDRLVGELSHGQRQWVELGLVLAADPELILLDEPAAGMTEDEVERTAELVRSINETHTMIVVEHDMAFIKMIARTVTVLNRGEILVQGPVNDVLADSRVRDVYLGNQLASQLAGEAT